MLFKCLYYLLLNNNICSKHNFFINIILEPDYSKFQHVIHHEHLQAYMNDMCGSSI